MQGYHYCPGQFIANVTTAKLTDYTEQPLLFDIHKDPGEKYPLPLVDPSRIIEWYRHSYASCFTLCDPHVLLIIIMCPFYLRRLVPLDLS